MRTNQEMLQALEGLLAISSVAGEDVTPEAEATVLYGVILKLFRL